MKHYKHSIIAFFALIVLGVPWLVSSYPQSARFIDQIFSYLGNDIAAVFGHESVTVAELQKKYDKSDRSRGEKVRILIVPGHEPDYGGTEFKDLKERDIVVDLAKYLEAFFRSNSHYQVMLSRDKNIWNPELQAYFTEHWNDIISFLKESREEMFRMVNNSSIAKINNGVVHNNVSPDVALRLYGINKWVNENNIDMVIHVHFNDYPRKNHSIPGRYSGFSIYVPERQYSNSTTTRVIAEAVFKRLAKYNAVSDLSTEESGVIEDQELIATGSYNTLDIPSMLIEYGYIYENQFTDAQVRDSTLRDLAFQTYLGVQDFFGEDEETVSTFDTLLLPHDWHSTGLNVKDEVLALQTALTLEGVYPPQNKTKNDCPRTGILGACTLKSLSDFQKKYNISGEKNILGERTRETLGNLYSAKSRQ